MKWWINFLLDAAALPGGLIIAGSMSVSIYRGQPADPVFVALGAACIISVGLKCLSSALHSWGVRYHYLAEEKAK